MNIWQVAAGDNNRNHIELCHKWGVIILGPGDYGPWNENTVPLDMENDRWSLKKISEVRRFCTEIQEGDIVILRLGTTHVYGVGKVVGTYQHNELFGDIDGWDLQHIYRVGWYTKEVKSFPTYTLDWGKTLSKLSRSEGTEEVFKWIETCLLNTPSDLPKLPEQKENGVMEYHQVVQLMYDYGVGSASIAGLSGKIAELCTLARWYSAFSSPSESETVVHLVVPLLKTLGWSAQRIELETTIPGKG